MNRRDAFKLIAAPLIASTAVMARIGPKTKFEWDVDLLRQRARESVAAGPGAEFRTIIKGAIITIPEGKVMDLSSLEGLWMENCVIYQEGGDGILPANIIRP